MFAFEKCSYDELQKIRHREDLLLSGWTLLKKDIRSNEYNLNIPRYVDSLDEPKNGISVQRCLVVFLKLRLMTSNDIGML